jgi:inorganic pyrophosphatase
MNIPPSTPILAYIEIAKGSDQKYEYNKQTGKLELDRVLVDGYVYPYAYGFIPKTLAEDGDELDILIISDRIIPPGTQINAHIIGALLMEDEKGDDHKILAVLPEEYVSGETEPPQSLPPTLITSPVLNREAVNSVYDVPSYKLEAIQTFFANYKKNEPGKWSVVKGFVGRLSAFQIYNKAYSAALSAK